MRFENGNLEFRKNGKRITQEFDQVDCDAFIFDAHQSFKIIKGERFPLSSLDISLINVFVNNYKIEETFFEAKQKKIQELKNYRKFKLNSNIVVKLDQDFLLIKTDSEAVSSITNLIGYLNDVQIIDYKAVNGYFKLNKEQLVLIQIEINKYIQETFSKEAEMLELVNIAETKEDLNSIVLYTDLALTPPYDLLKEVSEVKETEVVGG